MIEEHLRQDGCEVYYVDGLHSRVVVATFNTPERAAAWLAVWQAHAALEAERDALAAQVERVEAIADKYEARAIKALSAAHELDDRYNERSAILQEVYQNLRAALADPAPDAAADDAALDELRQSWWPRLDAVLGDEDEGGA